uniref:Ig-like domain-containing protein n=1 Tax=Lepisosteus oculatus TaxID=7918 RepID=W5MFA2_LEPOC
QVTKQLLMVLLTCVAGARSQIQVSQRSTSQTVTEGETAILHCNYTITATNFGSLQWYRQKVNRRPENIMILFSGNKEDKQFSGSVDTGKRIGVLNVSNSQAEDSATYYCAVGAQSEVDQPIMIFSYKGQKAALRCNHSIASFQNMYWYLQRSNGAPELLIYGYDKAEPKGRFSMEFDRAGRVTELHISDTQLEDAVMYYCAV